MLPYWLLFTLCAVGAIQFHRNRQRRAQGGPLLIFMALAITLMIGFRYEVGGDWGNYLKIFDDLRHEPFRDIVLMADPGYSVLNWVALRFGVGIWLVNLICAAIFMWGLTRFVKQQPNPWLALVVAVPYLIIVVAMGYTRQAAAIGFILAGLSTAGAQRITRFAFYIVLAAMFHKTAIIVLPLVALSQTRNRFVMAGLALLMGAMLYYLFLSASIDRLMQNYVEQEYEAEGAGIRVAMNLPPALLMFAFGRRLELDEEASKLWRNFSLAAFGALGLLYLLPSSVVVDRLALYLIPLQLVILSRVPFLFGSKGRENGLLTLTVIAYSALVQFVWLTSAANSTYWIPYQFKPF